MDETTARKTVLARRGSGEPPAFDDLPLEARTISRVVRDAAERFGSRPFVTCGDTVVSFADADRRANRVASAFASLGVTRGTRVAILAVNRLEYLDLWFGLSRLGAIQVPLNTAYKSAQIAHTLRRSHVSVVVVQANLAAELAAISEELPDLRHVVSLDAEVGQIGNARSVAYELIVAEASDETFEVAVSGAEPGAIMNTSGTTGLAKGVLLQQSQQYWLARNMALALKLSQDDVYYNFFPLFHNTAQAMIALPALLTGCRLVLTEKFSLSSFWPDVRAHGVTVFYYIGEILNLLVRSESGDKATTLRAAWGIGGAPADVDAFSRRHGIQIGTGYGSTEGNVPVFRALGDEPLSASCGKPLPEFEVLVVDGRDKPVAVGETGEIVIRATEPGTTLLRYDGDEEASREAMRGGWFHSGDAGRFDQEGSLYFVSRLKDVIRVRGENVSAFEVESVLLGFPGVVEAAAIAVPGELGGDDVKAVIVQSAPVDLAKLLHHCKGQLPKYSVPRYFEIVAELPKTPTNKIQKHILRAHGVSAATWDAKIGGPSESNAA